MTLTHDAPSQHTEAEVEALFPEARRRRRRIRISVGAVTVAALAGVAGLIYFAGNYEAPPKIPARVPATTGPALIAPLTIVRQTVAAGSARESWQWNDTYPGCNPHPQGSGALDLADERVSVVVTETGCLSGNGTSTQRGSYRLIQVGSSLYGTRQPQEGWPYGPSKTWLRQDTSGLSWLTSADPLRVLDTVSGPMKRVGSAYVRGVATTEYEGASTLAAVGAATVTANSGPIGTPDPPLDRIPIRITVWVDANGRVRQLSTWEPLYTQNYVGGASQGGQYITPWPGQTAAGPPRQQAHDEAVLDLWQFGTPVHITAPPAATVATAL